MRKHYGFILFFTGIILVFFKDIMLMKSAFISGDYLVQFYPWSKLYAAGLKHFELPFWTRYFNCGFPLMAEGQVGGFYPLNLVMFFMLPFKAAYNYSVVLHFVLAGYFQYIYSRKMGADQWGGLLSSIVFCFGSAYAGCFYNTVTVKTLIWFPLVLFLLEKYFYHKKLKYLIFAGIIIGFQFLAGFAQMAFYSLFFYTVYYLYGLGLKEKIGIKDLLRFGLVFLISGAIFYPQFILSWQLVQLSGRSHASLGFALWGSYSPLNLLGLYFPYSVISGTTFYIGVFTLLFLAHSAVNLRECLKLRPLFLVLILAFFLALGAYNPFYVFILKLTGIYSLRNPSKLLFFAIFAASVLAGWGFTKFFNADSAVFRNKSVRLFSVVTSIMLCCFLSLKIILALTKDMLLNLGKWYVRQHIFGKEYHRYDLSAYFDKVDNLYQQIVEHTALNNAFTVISIALCAAALLFAVYILRNKEKMPRLKYAVMIIITFDLYAFSFYGTGFRGNIKPFSTAEVLDSKITDILRTDKNNFRVLPFDLKDARMPWWLAPNANILAGIESIASYTPLAESKYDNALLGLEVVDSSLGILSPSVEALARKMQLLRLLNVKYIVTAQDLKLDFLEKLVSEEGVSLYRLKDYLPRVFFTEKISQQIEEDPKQNIKVLDYSEGAIKIAIITDKHGYLVFSERYYPGWCVYVDRRKSTLLEVSNLIQAVKIEKGRHDIEFIYKPVFFGSGS